MGRLNYTLNYDELLSAAARLLDVWGALAPPPAAEPEADAMRRDWEQVGQDMRSAMEETREQLTSDERERLRDELATAS